jgi:hypothetical protein
VQFPRLRRGVDAQFLAQPGTERRVGEQRPSGLARQGSRRHGQAAGRFVQRIVGQGRLGVACGGVRVARGERGLRRSEADPP